MFEFELRLLRKHRILFNNKLHLINIYLLHVECAYNLWKRTSIAKSSCVVNYWQLFSSCQVFSQANYFISKEDNQIQKTTKLGRCLWPQLWCLSRYRWNIDRVWCRVMTELPQVGTMFVEGSTDLNASKLNQTKLCQLKQLDANRDGRGVIILTTLFYLQRCM